MFLLLLLLRGYGLKYGLNNFNACLIFNDQQRRCSQYFRSLLLKRESKDRTKTITIVEAHIQLTTFCKANRK